MSGVCRGISQVWAPRHAVTEPPLKHPRQAQALLDQVRVARENGGFQQAEDRLGGVAAGLCGEVRAAVIHLPRGLVAHRTVGLEPPQEPLCQPPRLLDAREHRERRGLRRRCRYRCR